MLIVNRREVQNMHQQISLSLEKIRKTLGLSEGLMRLELFNGRIAT